MKALKRERAKSAEASQVGRIGWFDITETSLATARAPNDGYASSIIGRRTLAEIQDSDWRDTIALGPCIVNSAYDHSQEGHSVPIGIRSEVSWPDAKSARTLAVSLLEARAKIAEHLATSDNGSNVLIDATSISKSLLSSICGMLIRTRSVRIVDIIYQQSVYEYEGKNLDDVYAQGPLSHGINDIEFSFSAIPYVEGKYKSGARRHIVLLCGLDFQRTLGKVRELEAAQIDVVIEREALVDPRNASAFHRLCRQLGIPPERVTQTDRANVIPVIEIIRTAIARASLYDLHSIIVATGGKPFTIAGTLQSILGSESPMLSTIPDRVVELARKPAGQYKLYRLTDRTALL